MEFGEFKKHMKSTKTVTATVTIKDYVNFKLGGYRPCFGNPEDKFPDDVYTFYGPDFEIDYNVVFKTTEDAYKAIAETANKNGKTIISYENFSKLSNKSQYKYWNLIMGDDVKWFKNTSELSDFVFADFKNIFWKELNMCDDDECIRDYLAKWGIDPSTLDFIECFANKK
jgi:hypothetical protein